MSDDYNTLTEVARDALIYDGPQLPLKVVAAEIGKPYATLARELNPDDEGAKLGADLLLPIMRVTGDVRMLKWLADKLGYMLRRKADVHPDQPSWALEHAQDTQHLGEMARLMASGASPADVQREGENAIRDIEETMVRYSTEWDEAHSCHGRQ
ncbi:MAG: phage regulatory CII family protein [Desulfovibrio sp.]|uniref:phage regulatory CII family protein n=1 Tax=Desulfovibrio sp. TaxID=885 RepID=UPI002A90A463|nr:phage regulatory CII family protein [Desulfovibrio sp.]MDY6233284.1 phage regulatory CII family protein [Desulfovibrio sp.]